MSEHGLKGGGGKPRKIFVCRFQRRGERRSQVFVCISTFFFLLDENLTKGRTKTKNIKNKKKKRGNNWA